MRMDAQASVSLSRCMLVDDVFEIYYKMRMDNPFMFWLGQSVRYHPDATGVTVVFDYAYRKKEADGLKKEVIAAAERIRDIVDRYAEDDYGIELAIHDLFSIQIQYTEDLGKESHNIIGPLLYKKGVCEGIAMAVEYILNCFGIRGTVIHGDIKGSNEKHAWNIVLLDDGAYHLDVTWDLSSKVGFAGHTFFNVSDKVMSITHTWDVPVRCEGQRYNYYRRNGAAFTSIDDAMRYARRKASSKDSFEFRIEGWSDSHKVSSKLSWALKRTFSINTCPGTDAYFVSVRKRGLLDRIFGPK